VPEGTRPVQPGTSDHTIRRSALSITRSSSQEVVRLVADIMGGDRLRREAATARLAIIGTRALDRVLAALASTGDREAQIALLQVIERAGDPRGLAAAEDLVAAPDAAVAAAAVAALRPLLQATRADVATRALERLTTTVLDVARPDAVRGAALDALHDLAPDIVAPLCERLKDDPSEAVRRLAGWAATEDGARDGDPAPVPLESLARALPAEPRPVRNAIAEAGSVVPLPILHRLVAAIAAREHEPMSAERRDDWRITRGAAHQALAARGSRVALYDLRETIEREAGSLPVGMIAALAAIGDASCLEPLAGAIERTADGWLRAHLLDAFHRIRTRERLTRRHAVIKRLEARHPALVT
jgi:hypothetical protein